ncbi:MAG TPA: DinB family protein [Solirubrobacteraceae bacterium]|nr:DinB family protein [Solirubrobacteraceae bacterium]
MGARAKALSATAESQITELIERLEACEESVLRRPCPGRERLGDGTVGAVCAHVAQSYGRIAGFLAGEQPLPARAPAGEQPSPAREPAGARRRALASLLRRRGGHGPWMHGPAAEGEEADRPTLIARLTRARTSLGALEGLTDAQLDAVPPAEEAMRFCDGERTLEQVVSALLRHQGHQVAALKGAFASG